MVGKLDIFNMALGFIGTRMAASERENTPEAAQCRLYWDRARRAALRDFPYPFCQMRISLSLVDMPEGQADVWKHAYSYPAGALKINRINDFAPFEVMAGVAGLAIFCDENPASAVCSMDMPDVSVWDELFVTAMAYKLALLVAVPLLKNNSQKIQELASLYRASLPRLEGHAASEERKPKMENHEDWLTARWSWN